jgi:hypothetical protein
LPVAVGFGISNPKQAKTRRVVVGRRRRGQRGGESNCAAWEIKRFGQARGQICEITGECGKKHLEPRMYKDNSISEGRVLRAPKFGRRATRPSENVYFMSVKTKSDRFVIIMAGGAANASGR